MMSIDLQMAPKVLLVDDSTVERRALSQFLQSVGYAVDEASEGDAALTKIKQSQVDVVLLDLNMPDVDGFAVLSYLQEHRRALPVVLMSGMPLHKIQHKMNGLPTPELPPLLLKPIDPDQLLGLLELQLSGALPDMDALPPSLLMDTHSASATIDPE